MVKKAIERIAWRFSKGNFTPNENDGEAINTIIEYYESEQQKQYQANELFAKLYTYLAMKIMENDGSTVFENNHRRKIGNLLKKPLPQIMEDLTRALNDSEQYIAIEKCKVESGVIPKGMHHLSAEFVEYFLLSQGNVSQQTIKLIVDEWAKERGVMMDELMKIFKKTPEIILGDVWKTEDVEQAMITEINQMINLHR